MPVEGSSEHAPAAHIWRRRAFGPVANNKKIDALLATALIFGLRSRIRRRSQTIEPCLLLVIQRSIELLQVRANGLHRIHHGAKSLFGHIEPCGGSLWHLGW